MTDVSDVTRSDRNSAKDVIKASVIASLKYSSGELDQSRSGSTAMLCCGGAARIAVDHSESRFSARLVRIISGTATAAVASASQRYTRCEDCRSFLGRSTKLKAGT